MDSKTLSQWEIDSLLSTSDAVGPEEGARPAPIEKNIRRYNFKHPNKFSKEQLRALQMIFIAFARNAGSALGAFLRAPVEIRLSSIEQVIMEDYLAELPSPTLINIVSLAPLPDQVVVELNLPVAYVMLDRLLGGPGKAGVVREEPTEIEYSVFLNLADHLLASFSSAWDNIIKLSPRVEDVVLTPQIVESVLPTGVAILGVWEIRLPTYSGTMTMCIPCACLDPVADKLSTQTWLSGIRNRQEQMSTSLIDAQLRQVSLEIIIELGSAHVPIQDLATLQKSDIIRLDTLLGSELKVYVAGNCRFYGLPGITRNRLGVSITRTADDQIPLIPLSGPQAVAQIVDAIA